MRKYEILYILRHDSPSEVTQAAIDKLRNTITGQGGTILSHEDWGKKKLAYEIKKVSKGIYLLTTFAAPTTAIRELERILRIHPEFLRWLTVQLSDEIPDLEAEIAHYAELARKHADAEEEAPSDSEKTPAEAGKTGERKEKAAAATETAPPDQRPEEAPSDSEKTSAEAGEAGERKEEAAAVMETTPPDQEPEEAPEAVESDETPKTDGNDDDEPSETSGESDDSPKSSAPEDEPAGEKEEESDLEEPEAEQAESSDGEEGADPKE